MVGVKVVEQCPSSPAALPAVLNEIEMDRLPVVPPLIPLILLLKRPVSPGAKGRQLDLYWLRRQERTSM